MLILWRFGSSVHKMSSSHPSFLPMDANVAKPKLLLTSVELCGIFTSASSVASRHIFFSCSSSKVKFFVRPTAEMCQGYSSTEQRIDECFHSGTLPRHFACASIGQRRAQKLSLSFVCRDLTVGEEDLLDTSLSIFALCPLRSPPQTRLFFGHDVLHRRTETDLSSRRHPRDGERKVQQLTGERNRNTTDRSLNTTRKHVKGRPAAVFPPLCATAGWRKGRLVRARKSGCCPVASHSVPQVSIEGKVELYLTPRRK